MIEFRQPEEAHDLAVEAFKIYADDEEKFTPEGLKKIEAGLAELHPDRQSHFDAIVSLQAFVHYLQSEGVNDEAEKLQKLIYGQKPFMEDIRTELLKVMGDKGTDIQSEFRKRAGMDDGTAKTAPKIDAPAPEGSKKLSDFLPNPALKRPPGRG